MIDRKRKILDFIKDDLINNVISSKILFNNKTYYPKRNNDLNNLIDKYSIVKKYSLSKNDKSRINFFNKNQSNVNLFNSSKKKSNKQIEKIDSLTNAINQNITSLQVSSNKKYNMKHHSKWKLYRVITGHNGWVRCIDVDKTNSWFVTGSNDRIIKFWDLPTGNLKLSLTGHINTIHGLVISPRHPYLFSCGDDKSVKCWDLETNKVIRHYHGHLSGVHSISLHPTIDILVTGGRDCVARVWDLRSRQQIHCLQGHSNTVCSIATQIDEPQIITGSNDSTIKLWDISSGKCINTLTHHKKSIRSLIIPEEEYSFISGGCDSIKVWRCPEGEYVRTIQGKNNDSTKGILNSIALNKDGVFVSAGEEGILRFYDYESGEEFQQYKVPVHPGSLDCECGIFSIKFDITSTRMITAGCDKTIKMWKEEEDDNEI